jgi:hypothetical protein
MQQNQQVGQTILVQLGSNRFLAMTGAKQLVDLGDGLQFGLPRGARNKANKVRITLVADEYTVEFWYIRGANMRKISEFERVGAEALRGLFTSETGLDINL